MLFPKQKHEREEEEKAAEHEPRLESETLKDLTPSPDLADEVRGGKTTGGRVCECGTV